MKKTNYFTLSDFKNRAKVMVNESTYIICTVITKIEMNSCSLLCTHHLIGILGG